MLAVRAGFAMMVRSLAYIGLALALAGGAGLLLLHARGERLLSVQTASMVPTFRPGDALVVQPATMQQVQVGDVVSFQSPRDARILVSHRVISIDHHNAKATTAGDGLHEPDPPIAASQIIGRATAVAPRLGSILDFLHQPLGLVCAVYMPGGLLIAYEMWRLTRRLNTVQYRHPMYRVPDSARL